MRIPVRTVIAMLRDGMTVEELLDDFPDLEREDIEEAVRFGDLQVKASQSCK